MRVGFLLSNLFHPFPKPLKYFIDVALFFMVVMHGLQLVLLKSTQPKDQPISYWQEAKIFIFGVFEAVGPAEETAAHQEKVTATA